MNAYSERVFELSNSVLPANLPQWQVQLDGTLVMESVSPSGRKLWIATFGDEITVGFDLHHRHFGDPMEPDPEAELRYAAKYIENLVSGEYSIAIWRRNGQFIMSETVGRGLDPRTQRRSWFWRWRLRRCTVDVFGWCDAA